MRMYLEEQRLLPHCLQFSELDEKRDFLAALRRNGLAEGDFELLETDTTDPKGDENFGLQGYVTVTRLLWPKSLRWGSNGCCQCRSDAFFVAVKDGVAGIRFTLLCHSVAKRRKNHCFIPSTANR